jgi:hypothetical protein
LSIVLDSYSERSPLRSHRIRRLSLDKCIERLAVVLHEVEALGDV